MEQVRPSGYLANPPSGKGNAILVLHAWWGLNSTIKLFCDRLAAAGFVAFAPDLYHGKVVDTIAEAETMSNALNPDQARTDIADALHFLRLRNTRPNGSVAAIGFSLGAYFALELAVTSPEQISAVVVFYGTRPGDYANARAAFLGHFAETDPFEPRADVDKMEAGLRQSGLPVDFYHYPKTGHWFVEPDRVDAFNPAAASLAWERTLTFLNKSTSR